MFITLKCSTCGNMDCPYARKYIPEGSDEGCTRDATEDLAEKFFHFTQEVLPFLAMRPRSESTDKAYAAIEENLQSVYGSPLGRLLDQKGKIDSRREKSLRTQRSE